VARPGDWFGNDLLIADFGSGMSGDLAVTAVNAVAGGYSGGVHVLYGSRGGLSATDDYWTQDSPGITGSPEYLDQFGVLGSGAGR
jgi:hypothetical protein